MLATSKQLHNMVKHMVDITGNSCERRTWTDKRRTKNAADNERYISFKFGSAAEADFVADELRDIFALTGITAKVTRTSTSDDYYSRSRGGEYVRTIGTIG
jgi:hypothetical protein